MSDQFTEVTTKSWGSRLMDSIRGLFLGLILIIGSLILLWWNEGRAIHTENDLKDGSKNVVHLQTNVPLPENEDKLVHLTGTVNTTDTLNDPDFNIYTNAIALKRNVLIYQWEETSEEKNEKNLGGAETTTTTYSYSKNWVSNKINSDNFKKPEGHVNNSAYSYENSSYEAENVFIDSFKLSKEVIDNISNFETFALDSNSKNGSYKISSNTIYLGSGNLENNPQIGDVKISFEVVKPSQLVSIISKQSQNTLVPFVGKNGSTINELSFGEVSADVMFKEAISSNKTLTWILRLVGLVLCIFGFNLLFNPLVIIGDFVPFIGSIVGIGTGFLSTILGMIFSFVTVAIAWFFYRPIISIILISVVVLLFIFLLYRRKAIKK
jgi:hypothetical protein